MSSQVVRVLGTRHGRITVDAPYVFWLWKCIPRSERFESSDSDGVGITGPVVADVTVNQHSPSKEWTDLLEYLCIADASRTPAPKRVVNGECVLIVNRDRLETSFDRSACASGNSHDFVNMRNDGRTKGYPAGWLVLQCTYQLDGRHFTSAAPREVLGRAESSIAEVRWSVGALDQPLKAAYACRDDGRTLVKEVRLRLHRRHADGSAGTLERNDFPLDGPPPGDLSLHFFEDCGEVGERLRKVGQADGVSAQGNRKRVSHSFNQPGSSAAGTGRPELPKRRTAFRESWVPPVVTTALRGCFTSRISGTPPAMFVPRPIKSRVLSGPARPAVRSGPTRSGEPRRARISEPPHAALAQLYPTPRHESYNSYSYGVRSGRVAPDHDRTEAMLLRVLSPRSPMYGPKFSD